MHAYQIHIQCIYYEFNELQENQRGTHTTKKNETSRQDKLRTSETAIPGSVEKRESSVKGRLVDVTVNLANAESGDVD